jgi:diaminopimelate decarboxylase
MNTALLEQLKNIPTPYYYYDINLLKKTLDVASKASEKHRFHVHYAIKANHNPILLEIIQSYGFGADCVSGNEISAAINAGFSPNKITFAGVGKTDAEIELALENDIFTFIVEFP